MKAKPLVLLNSLSRGGSVVINLLFVASSIEYNDLNVYCLELAPVPLA